MDDAFDAVRPETPPLAAFTATTTKRRTMRRKTATPISRSLLSWLRALAARSSSSAFFLAASASASACFRFCSAASRFRRAAFAAFLVRSSAAGRSCAVSVAACPARSSSPCLALSCRSVLSVLPTAISWSVRPARSPAMMSPPHVAAVTAAARITERTHRIGKQTLIWPVP